MFFPIISNQPAVMHILDTPEIAPMIIGGALLSYAVHACCDCVVGVNEVVEAYKAEKMKRE